MAGKEAWTEGRLRTRPAAAGAGPVGLQPLELGAAREGYLYVPPTYLAEHTAPLVVLLHGAGEDARDGLALLRGQADGAGLILLAPSSREYTWDVIASRRYGPDIAAIDRALEWAFSRYAVDPTRVGLGGYSDGASYALSRDHQRGSLHARAGVLTGVHGTGGTGGFPARLRLPRHARQVAPDRPLQPRDRSPTRACRLRGTVPGVRGRPRGSTRDRSRGRGLVRRGARLKSCRRWAESTEHRELVSPPVHA